DKTFHTCQYDSYEFPYGNPHLMIGLTEDSQLRDELIHQRDRRAGLSTAARRRSRADIPTPVIQDGANSWEDGHSIQTRLASVEVKTDRSEERRVGEVRRC